MAFKIADSEIMKSTWTLCWTVTRNDLIVFVTPLAETVVLLVTWFQIVNTKVSIREFSNGRGNVGSGKECTQIQLHPSRFAHIQPVPSVVNYILACLSLLYFRFRFCYWWNWGVWYGSLWMQAANMNLPSVLILSLTDWAVMSVNIVHK